MSLILIHVNGSVQRQNGEDMQTNKNQNKILTKNILQQNTMCIVNEFDSFYMRYSDSLV